MVQTLVFPANSQIRQRDPSTSVTPISPLVYTIRINSPEFMEIVCCTYAFDVCAVQNNFHVSHGFGFSLSPFHSSSSGVAQRVRRVPRETRRLSLVCRAICDSRGYSKERKRGYGCHMHACSALLYYIGGYSSC